MGRKDSYQEIANNEDYNKLRNSMDEDLASVIRILDHKLSRRVYYTMITNMFSEIYISYPGKDAISVQILNDTVHVMDNREPVPLKAVTLQNKCINFFNNVSKLIRAFKYHIFSK